MVLLREQYFIDYKAPLLENLDFPWIILRRCSKLWTLLPEKQSKALCTYTDTILHTIQGIWEFPYIFQGNLLRTS